MKAFREQTKPIRSLVRRQLIFHIQEDLDGGELFMKEVWEQCETSDQADVAKGELEAILEWLRDRESLDFP